MEGFKANPKMKCDLPCFKEGGFVKRDKAKHSESTEMKKDVAKDKKIVKKAFKIHDEQSHDEKTDLSKLKKGGRAKKEVGTVKKYKTGGAVKKMADGGMGAQTDAELAMAKAAAAPTPPAMAPRKRRRPMATAGMGAVSDAERGMANNPGLVGQLGMGAVSDAERGMVNNPGLVGQLGMGPVSDDERMNMMRGLQAVGQYAYGGKVC
jgi:hypothetical protein